MGVKTECESRSGSLYMWARMCLLSECKREASKQKWKASKGPPAGWLLYVVSAETQDIDLIASPSY